jgi:hypothetical protein
MNLVHAIRGGAIDIQAMLVRSTQRSSGNFLGSHGIGHIGSTLGCGRKTTILRMKIA